MSDFRCSACGRKLLLWCEECDEEPDKTGVLSAELERLQTRLAQMTLDLSEAKAANDPLCAEVERLKKAREIDDAPSIDAVLAAVRGERQQQLAEERDEARAEVERLTKERDTRHSQALAALEAVESREAEIEALTKERDAYKRAKEENDERFIGERDDARNERDALSAAVERLTKERESYNKDYWRLCADSVERDRLAAQVALLETDKSVLEDEVRGRIDNEVALAARVKELEDEAHRQLNNEINDNAEIVRLRARVAELEAENTETLAQWTALGEEYKQYVDDRAAVDLEAEQTIDALRAQLAEAKATLRRVRDEHGQSLSLVLTYVSAALAKLEPVPAPPKCAEPIRAPTFARPAQQPAKEGE